MDSYGKRNRVSSGKGEIMKSLLKVIRRYSITVGVIVLVLFFINICVFMGVAYMTVSDTNRLDYGRDCMERIGGELLKEKEGITLSEKGKEILEDTAFLWAMALDKEGCVVWEWKLPEEIPENYTLQEVASFSRWYLKDYPVRIWRSEELLLVFGCSPERVTRYDVMMSAETFEFLPVYIKAMVFANFMVILLFIVFFGFQFYRSMRPLVEGVEMLALGKRTDIKEKGSMGELAAKLNLVSKRLEQQQEQLSKRDEARTEWIAGVSHDIRTPLSLIVGYSDKLAEDGTLSIKNRKLAENMKRQSLIIRQLIADLNLASKLEYQAQPLKKRLCSPAALLRDCIADFYNGQSGVFPDTKNGMTDFFIEVNIGREADGIRVMADEGLIKRALWNLIGNSIRHNEKGCHVTVSLTAKDNGIHWRIEDTGSGIPNEVVRNMECRGDTIHIMGLRIAAQIAGAHGGNLLFIRRDGGNYDVEFFIEREEG